MKRSPKQQANSFLNLFHKGFVWTCIGVTIYGTSYLGYRFFKHIFVTLPKYKEEKKLEEQRLLAEGSSENLRDLAPAIS